MTKIVGLTGGIGSGKTTIANYFKELGVPVYIADDEAKKIMNSDDVILKIKNKFGEDVLEDNKVNREKMAQIVFSNPEKLKELNKIIHPEVKKHFKNWLNSHKDSKYIIKEAAILFESGSYKDCDYIITVVATLESRIERILKRDNTTKENVLKRIKNQWSDDEKVAKSDFIIHNEDVKEALIKTYQIHNLLNNI
ncbi:dephospho-CoA kinase [Flavobacterium capsici]|uniref:Dephospho-CoA kinase n=1 Tax=Flavobacterium capsici TaxID=3075618 RepID=A0AA96ETA6_9FLAO|nr:MULTISPECIES: dephospho-CoA kinase [unclassified Flavobacterium]WNM18304.1 dephospho-CoA kinase [Flavobacterium sp. PMR2A8]WNM22355.1 dephospho-CoA kinase [Flavobacterium sp. PMTSA4]